MIIDGVAVGGGFGWQLAEETLFYEWLEREAARGGASEKGKDV